MAEREDIIGLLSPAELEILERVEAAGLKAEAGYRKIREFQATYPDDWARVIEPWIMGLTDAVGEQERMDARREKVKALERQVADKRHQDEGKFLDKRIAELEKELRQNEKEE
jgi:hypothetical protein